MVLFDMKKIFFLLSFAICFVNQAFSQEVRSNHSYRNLGFTQLPVVSIGGYIDVNGAQSTQETIYSQKVLNSVVAYGNNIIGTQDGIKNRATDDIVFTGEASLLFKVNGINDYGFKYGKAKIEAIEDIEILRFIENGYKVQYVEVDSESVAVDTPKDLERVRKIVEAKIRSGEISAK